VTGGPTPPTTVAGIDGCRSGWVVVTSTTGSATTTVEAVVSLDALHGRPLSIVGIDMPIGLSDAVRACDQQARRALGARACCVFSAPPRSCLDAPSFKEAGRRARLARGSGLSRQAFNLLPKISEVDGQARGEWRGRLVEVHPELSFAHLAGAPVSLPKRMPAGRSARLALLTPEFPDVADHLERRPPGVAADDLLDAFAVAWTARRVLAGTAERYGDGALDEHQLAMEIVA
jgi:predicted RNase H-like nuclease